MIINGIVTQVGLRTESINNGYEKWAEGISILTMAMTVKTSVLVAYINYSNSRG